MAYSSIHEYTQAYMVYTGVHGYAHRHTQAYTSMHRYIYAHVCSQAYTNIDGHTWVYTDIHGYGTHRRVYTDILKHTQVNRHTWVYIGIHGYRRV